MIQKNDEFAIEEGKDIFANDLMERKGAIEDLTGLLIGSGNNQAFVLSVNADWGAGKTVFIKLWRAYLQQEEEFQSIYFSAWENDFSVDPLVPVLGELNKYLKKGGKNYEELTKEVISSAVKFLTNNAIDVTALLNSYTEENNTLQTLKKEFEKLVKEIGGGKPFIIFIDELDRCRPLYAIELLERIKHVFNIPGLIFVLSIDKENLAESIKSQYGNIDTGNYLRRFIDLEYGLKNPSVERFCDVLNNRFELSKYLYKLDVDESLKIMERISKTFNLSLRQIERIYTKINIMLKYDPSNITFDDCTAMVLLEALKSYNEALYYQFISGDTTEVYKIMPIERLVFTKRNPVDISIDKIMGTMPNKDEIEAGRVVGDKLLVDKINDAIKRVEFANRFNLNDEK